LRKLAALSFAIPVIVAVYLATAIRRSMAGRILAAIAVGSVVGIVVFASIPPAPSTAVPRSTPRVPVAADFASSIRVGHDLVAPVQVQFSAPMDPASVAGALRIRPEIAISLQWNADGSLLSVQPVDHWAPDTLYTVSVAAGATDLAGGRLGESVRAAFLTADGGTGVAASTRSVGDRVSLGTAFEIVLDRPVDPAVATRALRLSPAVEGALDIAAGPDGGQRLTFRPAAPLAPGTEYRLWFEGLADEDGVPFTTSPEITVMTAAAPTVVRFRPRAGTADVERESGVSVRFTEPMARATTGAAFRLTVDGTAVAGTVSWAEGDTVLVFRPASAFPYSATVVATVDGTALSKAGAPLTAASGTFTVLAKPAPTPRPKPTAQPTPRPSGGGGAVSGSWTAVEAYYLKLMNCTRTGGLVTSTGTCSSPGGRDVAALKLDAGISTKVSRPYAKLLATRNLCTHFVGGNPGDRLRAAGYTSYRWAENLGCRSGDPYSAVLGSHLYFQSERNWSPVGGHYKNLMNSAYDRAGIGVWVSSSRVRLVVNLYHP
jgi:uncharacterized protein YkwD